MGGVISSSQKEVNGLYVVTFKQSGSIDSGYIRFDTPGATLLDVPESDQEKLMNSNDEVKKIRSGMYHRMFGMSFEYEANSTSKVKAVYINRTNSAFETENGTKTVLGMMRVLYMTDAEVAATLKAFDPKSNPGENAVYYTSFYSPEFRLKYDMPTNKEISVVDARKNIVSFYSPKEIPTKPVTSQEKKKSNWLVWVIVIIVLYLIFKNKK